MEPTRRRSPRKANRLSLTALPCLLCVTASAAAVETGLDEGQLFPDIVLTDLETGKPRSVSSLRGDKVLLHIFASW